METTKRVRDLVIGEAYWPGAPWYNRLPGRRGLVLMTGIFSYARGWRGALREARYLRSIGYKVALAWSAS